jgi:hypothetical protein
MARSNGAQGRRHRVAIVGGGFGGLFAARALRMPTVYAGGAPVPGHLRSNL